MTRLELRASSSAEEAGYRALADIAVLAARTGLDYRIVGGQMVSLHVAIAGVAEPTFRLTLDADLGVAPMTARDPQLVVGLRDLGYDTIESANRFTRRTEEGLQLIIDILAPSYGSQMLTNQVHGDLTLDEIPGLNLALARAGEQVEIGVSLRSGEALELITVIPEPLSALCLKLMAWNSRHAAKDALDVWRMLRVFRVRIPDPPPWSGKGVQLDGERALRAGFVAPAGGGARAATDNRSDQAEIRALALSALRNTPLSDLQVGSTGT